MSWLKQHVTGPAITSIGSFFYDKKFKQDPILIGGCARSGTTLLLSILSAHPQIYAIEEESDAFTSWKPSKSGGVKPVRKDRLYRKLFFKTIPNGILRYCEKRPANVQYIGQLLNYFGNGFRFIHLVRDPRAVCTSVHPNNPSTYWVSPDRWMEDVRSGMAFMNHPQVMTLKYEELVTHTRNCIESICRFAELPLIPEMLDWYRHATVKESKALFYGVTPISAESIRSWDKPAHKERIKEVLNTPGIQPIMKDLGYVY